MLGELNKGRYAALELIAEELRYPSRQLRLDAIFKNVPDEDLCWVSEKLHYFLLKLLEEADYDPAEEELALDAVGLTD